ncbi:MAG: YncE family protein [Lentimicrobium sp.]|nr:YncE family protein [Lentimicrobium sp.]
MKWILLFGTTLLTTSCKKEPSTPEINPADSTIRTTGIFVLNEGVFNANNASLTRFSFSDSTAETDYFFNKNGRKLGDTGSDLGIYGSKMYIVVNVSSQVEVVDALTCLSLKQIPMFDGNKPRQPRKIAFYGNHAFVCNFDGTVAVIDTTKLETVKFIQGGRNPDGITAAYGKIWVTNSGGLGFPDYDNTVSVIDPITLSEIKKLESGINPYTIHPDNHGNIFLIARGNYGDIKSRLQVMDATSGEMKHTFTDFEALNFIISGDSAFVYNYNWNAGTSSIRVINTVTLEVANNAFISDGTVIESVYGIAADPFTGIIYITDAGNFTGRGKVHAFSKSGKKLYSFDAGINPSGIVFANK